VVPRNEVLANELRFDARIGQMSIVVRRSWGAIVGGEKAGGSDGNVGAMKARGWA